jgi:hypothetical protein
MLRKGGFDPRHGAWTALGAVHDRQFGQNQLRSAGVLLEAGRGDSGPLQYRTDLGDDLVAHPSDTTNRRLNQRRALQWFSSPM